MDRPHPPTANGVGRNSGKPPTSIHTEPRIGVGKASHKDGPPPLSFQSHGLKTNFVSPVRRKPLPSSASPSPVIPSSSPGGNVVATGDTEHNEHPKTGHLEKPPSPSYRIPWLPPPTTSPKLVLRDLDQFPRGHSPLIPQSPGRSTFPNLSPDQARQAILDLDSNSPVQQRLHHARIASDPDNPPQSNKGQNRPDVQRSTTMPVRSASGPAPLEASSEYRTRPSQNNEVHESSIAKPNILTSFFGWKASNTAPVVESSPTTISDRSHSPNQSPMSPSPQSFPSSVRSIPHAIDVPKANASLQNSYFKGSVHPMPPVTPGVSTQLQEMEEELREISSELATSIRREMELEDLVAHLQSETALAPELNRRTSDYYSDSGASSVRFPLGEVGGSKLDDIQKMKRRSEQEKAQLRVNLSQRLQDERGQRKALEAYIVTLEAHVQAIERNPGKSPTAPGRVQELETALEDSRRRLLEERQLKENYEDLLEALRGEIEQHRNERDNLRDEVVPQLRARLEGLETEATEFQKLTYESTRMQQELQALKNENSHLVNVNRLQSDSQRSPRFGSIAEEDVPPSPSITTAKTGLTRSASLARGTGGLARSGSLSTAGTKERESRESLADRVKEIELQRDALHRALKSLLDRQKYQNREHEKRTKALEQERDSALESLSPGRRGYEKEVTGLRFEINQLRKRADDALEQKWQCEKGLGGLKKDLDRAEQETSSLRNILHENDILVPETSSTPSQKTSFETLATSRSLEKAYTELQATQALTVARLRELKGQTPSGADDAKTQEILGLLIKSMSDAEAERDYAQKQVEAYRAEAESLKEATSFYEGENAHIADQLRASANRVEALASQVRYQLDSNSGLRTRLAEAVGRGEREQKASAERINNMQGKLKSLEDRLMVAQQHSEEAVQVHEDEVKDMRASNNGQLQRLRGGLPRSPTSLHPRSNSRLSPRSPRSPMFYGARSPRLDKTSSGLGMSMNEALRTEFLERRVVELEAALTEADKEMQEVVQRMNMAQIEVMELQSARDDAMRQTKALQTEIVAESEKVGSLMRFLPLRG